MALAAACAQAPPIAPPAPAPPPRWTEVEVRPGETPCAVAGRFGVAVEALRAENGLVASVHQPLVARRLRVPVGRPLVHEVQPGETLARVAAWYGHSLATLERANAIEDPNYIEAGARLAIPSGARTACAPAPVLARAPSPPPVSAPAPAATARRAAPRKAAPGPPPELLARADDQLERASTRYDAADFQATVRLARSAQDLLAAQGEHPDVLERRALAAWLAGLAHAGLDDRENAAHELREALQLRPALRQDPRLSPRILPLLEGPTVEASGAVASGSGGP